MPIADSYRVTERVLEGGDIKSVVVKRVLGGADEPYLGLSCLSKSMGSMIKDCHNFVTTSCHPNYRMK